MNQSRALAAALIAILLPAAASPATWPGVPVLMYHRVAGDVPTDSVGRDLTLAPATFDAQLRWLRAHNIRTLTAAQLVEALARGEHPDHAVVLTFDDGYADAATVVTPALRAYGATATFFVSSGFIGTPRHAGWRQLRAMRAAGMEIACHGTFHLDLATLDRAGQMGEAQHCLATLARYLGGYKASTYAYPAGSYDATTLDVLRALRIKAAFTEHPGVVRDLTSPYTLPRGRISRSGGLAQFAALAAP